jgi:hypothetical protein
MSHDDNTVSTPIESARSAADVSRRDLFRSAAIAAGGAAALIATAMPAQAKATQADAKYQDSPKDGQSCSTCAMFRPPSSCALVDGTVSPDGWCKYHVNKSS